MHTTIPRPAGTKAAATTPVARLQPGLPPRFARVLGRQVAADEPGTRLLGDTAGMHIVLQTPPGLRPGRAADAARERGVAIGTLARYYAGPVTLDGLILGYGAASQAQVRQAAIILRDLLTPD